MRRATKNIVESSTDGELCHARIFIDNGIDSQGLEQFRLCDAFSLLLWCNSRFGKFLDTLFENRVERNHVRGRIACKESIVIGGVITRPNSANA